MDRAMVASVEASLRRLGTDYIDLLWTHGYDPHVPLEEVVLAFGHLVAASVRDRAVQVRRPRIAGCDGRRPASGVRVNVADITVPLVSLPASSS
jgi:Aldo/keto reductase family